MKGQFVSVAGDSMYPTLLPNDEVFITQKDRYIVGDILVYTYRSEQSLIHRLLRRVNNRYVCKGDNSFRIEDISYQDISGKVEFILRDNRIIVPADVSIEFLRHSLKIGLEFSSISYDRDKILNSPTYIKYKQLYLNGDADNEN